MKTSYLVKIQSILKKHLKINETQENELTRLFEIHQQPLKSIEVVVYGKFNHGKSSFLNAWLEKEDLFKVSDKRETQKVQREFDEPHDIYWVDTPGLDAEDKDERVAREALKSADVLLLVHNINAGELDKKEYDFLHQNHALVEKTILLLTQMDQVDEASFDEIQSVIKKQIGSLSLDVIPLSSIRYLKYLDSGSLSFKEKSNFELLRPKLIQFIEQTNKRRLIEKKQMLEKFSGLINLKVSQINENIKTLEEKKSKHLLKLDLRFSKICIRS